MIQKYTNKKGLMIAMAILLIANLVLLAFFLFSNPGNKKPERKSPMTTYLQNDIGFSKEQMAKFDSIKSNQHEVAKKLIEKMRANKEGIFKTLGEKGFSDSAISEAATYSALQQKELEMSMLNQLKAIRNICTPEQLIKFDSSLYKVMSKGRDLQTKHK